MPIALEATAKPLASEQRTSPVGPPARASSKLVRDFAVLLGAALTIGLTAALGMMVAVLLIS
ncbi:MAG: hypothetical protein EHM59_22160 [Betaproteobacteria bacterium]|nr:MAG: hypothetical protein EHM59_22160 [Betaproteobacteria bacterium]